MPKPFKSVVNNAIPDYFLLFDYMENSCSVFLVCFMIQLESKICQHHTCYVYFSIASQFSAVNKTNHPIHAVFLATV